ncbi:hypothetical protein GE061_010320 [Apolygus lucorum]|uniref:GOST seven transmembrane domain-containing protein n=1 Tax=Apolygus lucorum TaxID=248454 RepID=A0A8S9Y406_APOLU|nr:hypothetical protein GE061_010320 [Apolygus lucorum]
MGHHRLRFPSHHPFLRRQQLGKSATRGSVPLQGSAACDPRGMAVWSQAAPPQRGHHQEAAGHLQSLSVRPMDRNSPPGILEVALAQGPAQGTAVRSLSASPQHGYHQEAVGHLQSPSVRPMDCNSPPGILEVAPAQDPVQGTAVWSLAAPPPRGHHQEAVGHLQSPSVRPMDRNSPPGILEVVLVLRDSARPSSVFGFPEQAVWDLDISQDTPKVSVTKSVFKDSKLFITLSTSNCDGKDKEPLLFGVTWSVNEALCWQNYDPNLSIPPEIETLASQDNGTVRDMSEIPCQHVMIPKEYTRTRPTAQTESSVTNPTNTPDSEIQRLKSPISGAKRSVYTIEEDGFYKVVVSVSEQKKQNFNLQLKIELRSKDGGYLSAADWPLLPFYGIMCLLYVVLGLVWLIVSFLQWRDLLRIQFWIGGVIFLGMLEMATFYAEYSSYNANGTSDPSVVLLAEVVSCAKRTLARMLVIIVSLGFGIVKPRLGPMLHRVVGVGVLYFILAATEAYLRVFNRPKKDPTNQFVIATVPLAVLDSAICWWIFISLSQTTRTLRLRRNLVKLSLYRHFTNILIFSVVASVIFMLYSIKAHHLTDCFEDWKELWMDDAYWRLLFSIILIVIMILWRPTNNNQKYAFSPLLDAPDDDDEDEEDQFVNDAYGVKMRGQSGGSASPKPKNSINSPDDDLKWVEENIPASLADGALPILDSDEEIMATRFELSKMQ